jgi:hypothetical protein
LEKLVGLKTNHTNVQLVETHSIGRFAMFLAKNVSSFMFGEQQFLTNFSTIFVIHVPDIRACERLMEVNTNTLKGKILK